jgi:peptidoglycan/xylan/chitin deacetylase (PgdA/CDA1 family)
MTTDATQVSVTRLFKRLVISASAPVFKKMPGLTREIRDGITTFVFHDVSNSPSQFAIDFGLSTPVTVFDAQVRWIQSEFNVVDARCLLSSAPLPERACLITFDDGFRGTFENALPILERLRLPSVVFLNMGNIGSGEPLLSAKACFLHRFERSFGNFADAIGLDEPYHLTLSPRILADFEREYGLPRREAVLEYQGEFADSLLLRQWEASSFVSYGNHLYEHWNANALTMDEFSTLFQQNERLLSEFRNRVNMFAFTNGYPGTCFTKAHIEQLMRLGADRAFSAGFGGCSPRAAYCLERIALSNGGDFRSSFWFRLGRKFLGRREFS